MDRTVIKHIESSAQKCGGKPCIIGTRIRVWDVYVASEIEGKAPDQIVAAYPQINLADVHAALAYYWDHQKEIDQQMKEADQFIEELKATTGAGPLARKLSDMDTNGDSISS